MAVQNAHKMLLPGRVVFAAFAVTASHAAYPFGVPSSPRSGVAVQVVATAGRLHEPPAQGCLPPNITSMMYFQVLDTWGRATQDMGKYDQCNSIGPAIGYQFCVLEAGYVPFGVCLPESCTAADVFNLSHPMGAFVAFHIPQAALLSAEAPGTGKLTCGTNEQPWQAGTYAAVVLLALIAALCVAASAVRILGLTGAAAPTGWLAALDAFCLPHNIRSMVRMGGDRSGPLAPLNGVRTLSMLMVILGHTMALQSNPGVINPTSLYPPAGALGQWYFQLIPGADFCVDSFFCMSGFLAAYMLVKHLYVDSGEAAKGGAGLAAPPAANRFRKPVLPTLGMYVFHRLWRLIPAYGLVILVVTFIFPVLSSGPFWNLMPSSVAPCKSYWWTNLLFVSTIVPWNTNFSQECLAWTWYLSLDMEFALLLLPPLAVLYAYKPKLGIAAAAAACVAFLIVGEEVARQNSLSSLMNFAPGGGQGNENYSAHWYQMPYTRAAPYIVGILLGFALHQWDLRYGPTTAASGSARQAKHAPVAAGTEVELGGRAPAVPQPDADAPLHQPLLLVQDAADQVTGVDKHGSTSKAAHWMHRLTQHEFLLPFAIHSLCICIFAFLVYIPTSYYASVPTTWSFTAQLLYTAFSKTIWAVALAAMLFMCFIGKGGPITTFLAAPIWEPFARLTFGAYLWHPAVMWLVYFSQTQMLRFGVLEMAVLFLAFAVVSYALAAVLFVAVEKPTATLERVILGALKPAAQKRRT